MCSVMKEGENMATEEQKKLGVRISLRKLSSVLGLDRRTIAAMWRRAIQWAQPDAAPQALALIERQGFQFRLGVYLIWMADYREHDNARQRLVARVRYGRPGISDE